MGVIESLREVLWVVLVVLIFLLIKFWWSRRRLIKLTSVLPGHRPLPIVGNLLLFQKTPEESFKTIVRLFHEYGDTVVVWIATKPFVGITDPDDVQAILGTQRLFNRETWGTKVLVPFFGRGLLTGEGEHWRRHRKVIAPIFNPKMLQQFMDIFNDNAQIMVRNLRTLANGDVFDMGAVIDPFTLDTACETLVGVKPRAQAYTEHSLVKAIQTVANVMHQKFVKPWLLIDKLFNMTQLSRDYQVAEETMHESIGKTMINKFRDYHENSSKQLTLCNSDKDGKEQKSVLDFILSSAKKEWGITTLGEVKEEVYTLVAGGQDTSANTIGYVFMLLALNPDVQDQVFEELQEVLGQNADGSVVWDDLPKLQCLERVLKETMRLYPVGTFLTREIHEEVKLRKCTLPAGCGALLFSYVIHRNPEYYPDPEKFDPERFLPENVKTRHPYSYIPFGGGSRMCVGYKYAMAQMKVLMATVLRKYRVLPAVSREEMNRSSLSVTMRPVGGYYVKMLPRK